MTLPLLGWFSMVASTPVFAIDTQGIPNSSKDALMNADVRYSLNESSGFLCNSRLIAITSSFISYAVFCLKKKKKVKVDAGHGEEIGAERRSRHLEIAVIGQVAAGGGTRAAGRGGPVRAVGSVAAID